MAHQVDGAMAHRRLRRRSHSTASATPLHGHRSARTAWSAQPGGPACPPPPEPVVDDDADDDDDDDAPDDEDDAGQLAAVCTVGVLCGSPGSVMPVVSCGVVPLSQRPHGSPSSSPLVKPSPSESSA